MTTNELIYGKNAVESLLEANKRRVNKLYVAKGVKFDDKLKKIVDIARGNGIIVNDVPREKMNSMVEGVHQGVIASVSPIEYFDFDDYLDLLKSKEGYSLTIVLDGVEDPHNLGAIIRTAVCAGADGILIPKRRSVQVTATVEKTSAGAVEKIPVVQVNNISQAIEKLKEINVWVVGAEASGKQFYFDVDYKMNCALVLGGENQGVGNLVKKNCDFLVNIPMPGKINSLNVSNAASILIYEVIRQRMLK